VKKALLSLALAVFAVGVAQAQSAAPLANPPKVFYIAEAYPGSSDPYVGNNRKDCLNNEIHDNRQWTGAGNDTGALGPDNVTAVPGILSLGPIASFQTVPDWCVNMPRIQSVRFTKKIPTSLKCPGGYNGTTWRQFGVRGIRTWWNLLFTAPGTSFTLEITSVCEDQFRRPVIYKDTYVWIVTVNFESLRNALRAMRLHPIGFCEVPCVVAKDHFDVVIKLLNEIEVLTAFVKDDSNSQMARDEARVLAQDKVFTLEAICVGTTAFTDCFIPEECFSSQFPPTDEVQLGDMGFTAFLDTIENPCCCKLLVDIERLTIDCGISTP
jgi:hypothetical protein